MKKLVNSVKGKTELPNIKQRSGSTTGRRADTRNRAAPQKRAAPVARLRVLVPQVCAWLHTHPDVGTEHAQLSRYPSHLSKVIKKSPWEPVSSRASGSGHCSELWPGDGAEHDSRRLGSERPATLRVPQVGTREPTQTSGRPTLTFPALPGRSVKVLQGQTRRPRPGMQVRRPRLSPSQRLPQGAGT